MLAEKFESFTLNNHGMTLNSLMREGAAHYIGMCNHVSVDDFYSPGDIRKAIDEEDTFDEFFEQSIVMDKLEEFAARESVNEYDVIEAIKNEKGEEVKTYLKSEAYGMARELISDKDH